MDKSKPREFWIYRDLNRGSMHFSPTKLEGRTDLELVNHVIEYSAYEFAQHRRLALLDSANRWAAETKAERAKNAKLVQASTAVLSDVDCAPVTGGLNLSTIENLRKTLAENGEQNG